MSPNDPRRSGRWADARWPGLPRQRPSAGAGPRAALILRTAQFGTDGLPTVCGTPADIQLARRPTGRVGQPPRVSLRFYRPLPSNADTQIDRI